MTFFASLRNLRRRTQILLAGFVAILAIVSAVLITSSYDAAPVTGATVPAGASTSAPTDTQSSPAPECVGDFTKTIPLWEEDGEPQGRLFLTRIQATHTTCGFIWMAGSQDGIDQKSITLTLCDGPCKGESSGGSATVTAVDTFATTSVFLVGDHGVAYEAEAITPDGKQLRDVSDGPIYDG